MALSFFIPINIRDQYNEKVMIKINEKTYEFKYSLRSMFIFEEIAGKPFEISALIDTYVFAYSCVLANKDNPSLEFEEFIDACDADPSIIEEFNRFISEEMKKRETLGKKKVTTRGRKSSR